MKAWKSSGKRKPLLFLGARQVGKTYPVGKVDFMKLYPMSFQEFLLAMGETGIAELLEKNDLENRDRQNVRSIQNQIILAYRNDFSKHAPKEILPRINMVWDSIPAQLSKASKKFIYGVINEGARAKDFELAIQWLTEAGLLHKVCNTSKPALPFFNFSVRKTGPKK